MTQTATEAYAEALAELRKAEVALDQGHAMLKDLGLERGFAAVYRDMFLFPEMVCDIVKGLADDMNTTDCRRCGKRLGDSAECIHGLCAVRNPGGAE